MSRALRTVLFAIAGGVVALLVGLIWVALAPDNGFGDLAAASVTVVFLIPLGLVIGAIWGWRSARAADAAPPAETPSSID